MSLVVFCWEEGEARHGFFAFAEVEAADVENGRYEVDEEETDDSSVDVDDVVDIDFENAHHEAYADHQDEVDDLADFDLTAF